MKIGDIFLALRADGTRFQAEAKKEAEKAGDAAGKTLGSRIGKAANIALRGGLTVLAGGAAIATKGLVELDDTMARFTADTGASAEEAAKARKAILKMSGDNLKPMQEIGDTMGKVETDLGLVGDAAADTTQDFLHFSRVTGQDAAAEVAAFDDILDSWNLTADDSQGIMDKLVVSHQQYGGVIGEDEAALAAMAPQLKAFNLNIDDGIGLLNLFKSSGLDAASIPRALNSAIQKLDGRPLGDFIKELASIEDPGLRAQRAIEVFGSKAGVGLANAIKPGMTSLDDFKISTDEATGATEKARDAIDGTFSNRVQLAIKGVTTKITEFGDSFGPALTGLASIASLGAALGLDTFVGKFAGKLLEAGKKGGQALIDGIGTATGAAGTVIGNFFASRVENILDPAKNTLLGRVIRAAGSKAATIYLTALIAGDRIGAALMGAWTSIAGTGSKATAAAGAAGKAAGLAFRAGLLLALASIADDIEAELNKITKEFNLPKLLGMDLKLDPSKWPWPLGPADSPLTDFLPQQFKDLLGIVDAGWSDVDEAVVTSVEGMRGNIAAELSKIPGDAGAAAAQTREELLALGLTPEEVDAALGPLTDGVRDAFGIIVPKITDSAEAWDKYRAESAAAQEQAITDQLDFTSKALSDLTGFQSGVEAALSGVLNAEQDAQITQNRITILMSELRELKSADLDNDKKITKAERAEYENRRLAIENELTTLKLHLALIGDDMHRVTALNALLTAQDLKTNLLSENDNIRTAAQVQRDKIISYLVDIETQGGPAAKKATAVLAQWMNPTNPLSPLYGVDGAAGEAGRKYIQNLTGEVEDGKPRLRRDIAGIQQLMDFRKEARNFGLSTGEAYANGLELGLSQGIAPVVAVLRGYQTAVKAGSPPKPGAVLYGIDKWGEATGEAYASPFAAAIERLKTFVIESLAGIRDALSNPPPTKMQWRPSDVVQVEDRRGDLRGLDALQRIRATAFEPGPTQEEIDDAALPVVAAFAEATKAAAAEMGRLKEIAKLEGFLASTYLADGLASKRPEVRAEFEAWRDDAQTKLTQLRSEAGDVARGTGQNFADGLAGNRGAIDSAAETALSRARGEMKALRDDAGRYGYNTGSSYASRLTDALEAGLPPATAALRAYKAGVIAGSPPRPGAVLYGIDKWGAATGEAYVNPLIAQVQAGVTRLRESLADMAAAFSAPMGTGSFGMPAIEMAGAAAAGANRTIPNLPPQASDVARTVVGGSVTNNYTVQVPGLLKAEKPSDVVRSLRHLNAYGTFDEERK